MTSDAPQSPKNGSVTDSTSPSPSTTGTWTTDAGVVGEPSSADLNPDSSGSNLRLRTAWWSCDVESRYKMEIPDN
jgi:hypothetical protein